MEIHIHNISEIQVENSTYPTFFTKRLIIRSNYRDVEITLYSTNKENLEITDEVQK